MLLTSILGLFSWVSVRGCPPDVPAPEQPELFLKKLQQCCTVFDFMDTLSDLKMKEYKRSTLNELVDYVTVSRGYLTEQAYPEVVKMVSGRGLTGLLLLLLFGSLNLYNRKLCRCLQTRAEGCSIKTHFWERILGISHTHTRTPVVTRAV